MKKESIICNLLLFIIFILFSFLCYGKCGGFIYDTFREAVIPEQILQGKILYKDIFCLYPPAAFYLNALLFKIFGSSLNLLFYISVFNTSIILFCLYKITKEISDNKILTPFITVLTVMLIFVFRIKEPDSANWFYPYSFSFTYAFTFCMIFVTSIILYFKRKEIKYLYLASLFLGLSIAFKLDFTLCFLILLFFIIKTKSKKIIPQSLFIFLIPIFLEFLLFLLNTKTDFFNILSNQIKVLITFANVDSVKNFNHLYLPQFVNLAICNRIINSFIYFSKSFLAFILISSIFYLILNRIKGKKLYIMFIIFLPLLILGIINIDYVKLYYLLNYDSHLFLHSNLIFLNYLLLILTICLIVYKKVENIDITIKEKFFILSLLIAYCICFRNYAGIYISNIGNFTIILFWVLLIIYLLDIVPDNFKLFDNKKYRTIICTAIILYSLTYTYQYIFNLVQINKNKLEFPKGTFYISNDYYKIINKALSHAQENISGKNKSLLYIEEGLYLHYLLNIPVINYQIYSIQSHIVPTLGEDYIINILKEEQPDYIYNFIPPIFFRPHKNFGIDYGKKINDYIQDNYIKESTTGNNTNEFEINKTNLEIYKKK